MPTVKITHGDVGDVWVPQATFTVSGSPTDPTTITVKIKDAAGAFITLGPVAGATGGSGIVRVSQGVFNTLIPITAAGYWACNFTGTGAAAASEDHEYIADPSGFTSNYGLSARALVGLQETKDWLQGQNINTGEDLDLVRVINDLSERAHQEAEREFKPIAAGSAARLFPANLLGWQTGVVEVGDLASYTKVEIIDTDWATVVEDVALTDVTALPFNRQPWQPIRRLEFRSTVAVLLPGRRVRVTGTWGFPVVPGNVRQAVLDAVAAVMDRDVEHYSQDLAPAPGGENTNVIVLGGRPAMLSMPAASLAVLWSYRDPLIA